MYLDTVVIAGIVTVLAMVVSLAGMGVYAYKHIRTDEQKALGNKPARSSGG